MEVDEIQTQPSKFSRINSNGKIDSSKVGNRPPNNSSHNHHRQYPDEFETGSEQLRSALVPTGTTATTRPALTGSSASALLAAGEVGSGAGSRLRSWQHSSRIIRVSRASGGKDRHSKVWTAKGPRDRRVRLSVTTAIQFYDLQDRLGFDQPSKAVEWLIKAAADSIAELPALNGTFPETPRQLNDVKRGTDHLVLVGDSSFDVDLDGASGENPSLAQNQSQNQPGSNLSKSSNCSSTSETSKGSGGLSLSRTEIRVKARERARVRTAKEKDKETDLTSARVVQSQQNVNRQGQALSHQTTSSFTQLLTSGIGLVSDDHNNTNTSGIVSSTSPQEREQQQQWCSPMDYFSSMGLMGPASSAPSRTNQNHPTSGFIQLGNSIPQAMTISPLMSIGGDSSQPSELHNQHYAYGLPDHHLVVPALPTTAGLSAGSSSGHYNLNFSISSSNSPGLAGFSNSTNNRGTLQSNSSQSHYLPHLQRFSSASSSAVDVSTQLPFLLGTTVESHQHHPFPAGFQLCYGDNVDRHSDHRGKGKN